jgi:membrane-bound serine protease (ClpP class)
MRVAIAISMAAWLGQAAAAEPPAALVRVRLPIVGTRDTQVETAILKRLDTLRSRPGERGVLVLEFGAADDGEVSGSDFGRAFELARFLTSDRLTGVKTVAFLPEGARGQAVLVALACEEIVMPADAALGPANDGEPIDEAMRAAYTQIAARRRTVPPAVALGLLDPAMKVARVSTADGERFVSLADVETVRREVAVLGVEELVPMPLVITGRRGRELGFVRLLAKTP